MPIIIENQDINKFVIIGDRVLIKPKASNDKTRTGLFLPPGVAEKEQIHSGYILKTGPGYPVPSYSEDSEEFWKEAKKAPKYIPLQVEEGDLAVYLQSSGFEIQFNQEKYVIVPHSAILFVVRDEGLFE